MSKILMYSTRKIVTKNQTGGTKRFIELSKYMQKKFNADLCAADDSETLKSIGLNGTYQALTPEKVFLTPEISSGIKNRKLIKKIKKENYDHIIVFDVPPALTLCLAHLKHVTIMIRKDLLGYEDVSNEGKKSFKIRLRQLALKFSEYICMKRAETVVCQCEYDKNALIERHKTLSNSLRDKIHIQINNVNPSWIVAKSEKAADDNRGLEDKTLCFVGGFDDKRKGQDIFLSAVKQMIDSSMNITAYVAGGGKNLDLYKEEYKNYDSNICFCGRVDNPICYVKHSKIAVVPSLADSCPNTVMESLYNGVTVIGSKAGGIPEILVDKEMLFETNAEDLKKSICLLLNDSEHLSDLQKRQEKRKNELIFDWAEKIAKIIVDD